MAARRRHGWAAWRTGQRGQAFVELAIIMPMLFVIIFAVIEFGLVIADQETVIHAAADGARIGARGDSPTNAAAAQSQATSYLSDLHNCPSPTVTVTYDEQIPDYVHVKVSCVYHPITPVGGLVTLIGGAINSSPTISSTTIMRVQ